MTSDAWNNLTIAAGCLERAMTRIHGTLADYPELDGTVNHLDDVIRDVDAAISKIVEMQDTDRLERKRYDREVAMDLRGTEGET